MWFKLPWKLIFPPLFFGAQELQIHSLKATIKIRIDVPSELTALSRMSITDEKLNQNIKTVYLFDHIEETTADGMHIRQRLIQLPFFGVYKMISMQVSRFVYIVLLERVKWEVCSKCFCQGTWHIYLILSPLFFSCSFWDSEFYALQSCSYLNQNLMFKGRWTFQYFLFWPLKEQNEFLLSFHLFFQSIA